MPLNVQRARQAVPLCLNLALKAEHERAVAALEEARREDDRDPREASSRVTSAAEAVRAIEEQMRGQTVQVILEALSRKAWIEFVEAHPPRDGETQDKTFSVDISSLDEAIIASIREIRDAAGAVVDFDPAREWMPLADEMSSGQWNEFGLAVLHLNNGVTAAPFSPAALRAIQRSAQTSKRPND